ncbi:MAG: zinc-ribbon domain-containing protein [Chloroflexota bacterium]
MKRIETKAQICGTGAGMQKSRHRRVSISRHIWKAIVILTMLYWGLASAAGVNLGLAQGTIPDDLEVTIGQFDVSKYPEITLYVNVKNRGGGFVTALEQEQFSVTEDGTPVDIVAFAGLGEARPVDIVYVFDTTGSMSNEIDGVIHTSQAFADELVSKGRDYRLGLVSFGDIVRQVYRSDGSLTDNAGEFKGWVGGLSAQGGDGERENDFGAIKRATQMSFHPEAQKIFILITDAPPHRYNDAPDGGATFDDPDLDYQPILKLVRDQGASVYAVTPNYTEFTSLATDTGGRFYDIDRNPDFTGLIGEIGSTIANQYRITYRSPRPNYDGTRRNVEVKVGSTAASTAYHERHLVTIQSNLLVGAVCLLPLLAALAIPVGLQALGSAMRSQGQGEIPVAAPIVYATDHESAPPVEADRQPGMVQTPPAPSPGMPPAGIPERDAREQFSTSGMKPCQRCGKMLRSEARFCPACGQPVAMAQPGIPLSAPKPIASCPSCGRTLRPGARFCNGCGTKLS